MQGAGSIGEAMKHMNNELNKQRAAKAAEDAKGAE